MVFRVYLVVSKIGKHLEHQHILTRTYFVDKGVSFSKTEVPAASLERRRWGLGISKHTQIQIISIDMSFIATDMN